MINDESILVEGDEFEGVLLETYKESGVSRPRVRPLDFFDNDIKVEFPRNPRKNNPLKTRFRASVKVCQKYHKKGKLKGQKKGQPYLYAYEDTIIKVKEFIPNKKIEPIQISDRVYKYVERNTKEDSEGISLQDLREKAYKYSSSSPPKSETFSTSVNRNELIKEYALMRSNGNCEACGKPAPFLKKNDNPYLEVHHIKELSKNGLDSPKNVAAICPNCHARITHGKNAANFNEKLKKKILNMEDDLSSIS